MWEGYLKKPDTKKFIEYFETRGFTLHSIHTSGHADISTLKQMVKAIKPQSIVPIHTFHGKEYKNIFSIPIVLLKDGEII
jgi:ribonuclease J